MNVKGVPSILEHVRLVRSSLWSDAALLYRQEIGLDADRSLMAVVVQEFIDGERSGVVFGSNPADISQIVLESVYGLNQGLVDGMVEPDRWLVNRSAAQILSHTAARRNKALRPARNGIIEETLPPEMAAQPPLSHEEVLRIASLALQAERAFGSPQDMEWTIKGEKVIVLQSRPINTLGSGNEEDKRTWYLGLRRSFENLKLLRSKIENEFIPAMVRDAKEMAAQNLAFLSDEDLAEEISRRKAPESHWTKTYWEDFIPFAHGVRLFGQFYNDTVHPKDPYEFVRLLGAAEMESIERNRDLEKLASMVRRDTELKEEIAEGNYQHADPAFLNLLNSFILRFGDLSCPITGVVQCSQGPDGLLRLVLEMAVHPPPATLGYEKIEILKNAFLNRFEGERRIFAAGLLDLARAGYRLRDDDNIKLGRIEAQKLAALEEAKRRIDHRGPGGIAPVFADQVPTSEASGLSSKSQESTEAERLLRPRQMRGQPAGPGIARGPARVIRNPDDLLGFKHGDILVCDAVDPNMTYVVPLAAAAVERRGGMLIHGAIIAREYGPSHA